MISPQDYRRLKIFFQKDERKKVIYLISIIILATLSTVTMVGAIYPLLNVLSNPSYIFSNKFISRVYDFISPSSEQQFIIFLATISLLLIVCSNLMQIYRVWLTSRIILLKVHSISTKLMSLYLRQDYEYLEHKSAEELSSKVLSETMEVVNHFIRPITDMFSAALTILSILALLFLLKPVVALIVFSVFGSFYGAILFSTKIYLEKQGMKRTEANLFRYSIVNEAFKAIKYIKFRGKEQNYISTYSKSAHSMANAFAKIQFIAQVPHYILHMLGFSLLIASIIHFLMRTGSSTQNGLLEILPTLGLFAFAGQRILPEISKIYSARSLMLSTRHSAKLLSGDIINLSRSNQINSCQMPTINEFVNLRLSEVSYQYQNTERLALSNISLSIKRGEKIGIVGRSGSGKSTLVDVILGFRQCAAGLVTVNGEKLDEYLAEAWRAKIGYVPQDVRLIEGSIADNIIFYDPIDQNKLSNALESTKIKNFGLNDDSNELNGELVSLASNLSGGQRQRVAAARALYNDPDILIFDEATSSLDNITQQYHIKLIESFPKEKTVLIVAHRLKNVMSLDRIIIMKNGKIVGDDNPQRLSEENLEFKELLKGEM